ncbi:RICIN domain-containing protein [Aquimarina agarivorans]|uniref:RICIN domain-containing protein n=1 Tax=Aquimarina agarivorans TaxID=980584 RepID=UPI000B9BB307|nr:RICIN domain-containing protein [Aquimarina agarivorans]
MNTIRNLMGLILLCSLFATSLNAQVFTLNGGYRSFPAQEAGTPGLPNGNVMVRKAPAPKGNINQIRRTLNAATIPDVVIQSRLTQGPLAGYIAQMPAVKSTANKLNARRATVNNIAGAIIINSTASLNANRSRISNNNRETYIFRNNINVNNPIVVGSNKTFWIDGKVTYTGPNRPLANTDALSPIPIIRDGIFRIKRKNNITINGTKRGLIDCKSKLPFAYTLNSRNITITNNEVINGFNTIFIHQTRNVTVENNFFYNNVRRAMHLIAVNGFSVKNNLCYGNHLDGIDVDAFCQNGTVDLNVVLGVNFRFMLWTEIDAHNNVMNNNVAIHLPGRRSKGVGGMQENGTENSRRGVGSFKGTRNNDWINNHVFYPETFRDGIVMRKDRFIQHSTIKFENNYVWSVEGNGQRHNPKPQNNNTNDVRFITLNTPAAGTKARPTNLYPNGGPEVLINSTPPNLTSTQIKVTPNLFGSGNTPPPPVVVTPQPNPTPNNGNLRLNGTYFIRNKSNSQNIIAPKRDNYNARMYDARTSNDQKWQFKHIGNGVHTIKNIGSQRYLEVPFAACANGSNISTWTSANSNHQKWIVTSNNGNVFLRPNHCKNRTLDKGVGINKNVQVWEYNTSNSNQRFELVPVNGAKILDNTATTTIRLFPNPTAESLHLNLEQFMNQAVSYTITSVQGQKLSEGNFNSNHSFVENISLNTLGNGMYFISIKTANGSVINEKFMISKK